MERDTMKRIVARARRAQAAARETRNLMGARRQTSPSLAGGVEADAAQVEARIEREHREAVRGADSSFAALSRRYTTPGV